MKLLVKLSWLLLLLACNWQRCITLEIADPQVGLLDPDYHLGKSLSWHAANYYCTSNNLQLVSIQTLKDSVHLIGFLQYYNVTSTSYWTSGNKLLDSSWRWGISGNKFTYLNWKAGRPSTAGGSLSCVSVNKNDSTWLDENCSNVNDYICEKVV